MSSKAKRCIYNANRHAIEYFDVYCTWSRENIIALPPHLYIESRGMCDKACKKCKCFKEDKKTTIGDE